MIKFHNREFYERFTDALLSRYKNLKWKDPRKEKTGEVTSNKGQEVGLRLLEDARSLIVTLDGNSSWVMNDFQNICKNVRITGTKLCVHYSNSKNARKALIILLISHFFLTRVEFFRVWGTPAAHCALFGPSAADNRGGIL